MFWSRKYGARRTEVRKNRPDRSEGLWAKLRARGVVGSLVVAAVFCLVTAAIVLLREDSVPYRPGQYVPQDVLSRVDFSFTDADRLTQARKERREGEPCVYKSTGDAWGNLETALLELPDRVGDKPAAQLPGDLATGLHLDPGSEPVLAFFRKAQSGEAKKDWQASVHDFIATLRPTIVLPRDQRAEEVAKTAQRFVMVVVDGRPLPVEDTCADGVNGELLKRLNAAAAKYFLQRRDLPPRIATFAIQNLKPTHVLDQAATVEAQNRAAERVPTSLASVEFKRNQVLVEGGRVLQEKGWQLLKAEKEQFVRNLGRGIWKIKLGLAAMVVLVTAVLCVYTYRYQRRVVRNRMRAIAVAALMTSMLLLAQLAAIGTGPLYVFGLAPTILVAMILTIAYDQRFAVGIASMHALLVTVALDQGTGFYIIQWLGVFACCTLLGDVRSRSRLVEVGGATALTMMAATAAVGAIAMDPVQFVAKNCLYTGAGGIAVGFVVLGILPFIEKAFRITTSMTLLELADASQPLLRRLALEAPGTYNHSLQVATLAEAAAEAIGANSLLCRIAAYYHDAGKIHKADYFVENQSDGKNRHINLTPSVSLLIIIGHVKDGIELAREYNLPTSLFPFIQQHHGTTLIEYFYHRACNLQDATGQSNSEIPEEQYRYPGPKPKSKEIAILMICDAVESAVRAMPEPNASRIETLVHEIAMKRLHDGQFDECDLTFKDLQAIERSCVKTLVGVYHSRIAYPSTQQITAPAAAGSAPQEAPTAAKTA
jgi:putative nucleotidyltransferase with HDIG domain